MAYIKTTWENEPSESTPINASNLNKIENGIYQNSVNIGELTNLETTNKTNVVSAINELKDAEAYSTTEVKTNKIWIDNKPIYRKVYTGTTISGGAFTTIDSNFTYNIISFNGTITNVDTNTQYSLVGENGSNGDFVFAYKGSSGIQLCNSNTSKTFDYYLIVEYTK